jgi:hypothetical protein
VKFYDFDGRQHQRAITRLAKEEWVMQSLNSNKERYPDQSLLDWQIIGI